MPHVDQERDGPERRDRGVSRRRTADVRARSAAEGPETSGGFWRGAVGLDFDQTEGNLLNGGKADKREKRGGQLAHRGPASNLRKAHSAQSRLPRVNRNAL